MKKIIETLTKALHSDKPLIESLNQTSKLIWQENYPVAVVHEKKRIKEQEIIASLEGAELFDSNDLTPTRYNDTMIDFFRLNAPKYLKQISIMCLEDKVSSSYTFNEKRPHDYWKKVENSDNFKVAIEISTYTEVKDICQIESELRNIMRSSKEVPSVKAIGFVWIAMVPDSVDIRELLQHYFKDNHKEIAHNGQIIYIGWSNTLKEVNMRYFVCPPE